MSRIQNALMTIMVAAMPLVVTDVEAQDKWPSRPVTLIVPVGAGTTTDVTARLLAEHLRTYFGQAFVIDNRPGAAATLGARYVAKARPDGYTLLMGGNTTHSFVSSVFKTQPYDPVADFTPIARVGALGQVLATNTLQPFKTIQEMVAYAKANPGKLSYGHGNASAHIIGETIKQRLGLDIVRVPYASNPTAATDLLGNSIQLMPIDMPNGLPLIEASKIIPLALPTLTRNPRLPGTPTLHETMMPGFELSPWVGVFGPPNLPQSIVEQISVALGKITADETFIQGLRKLGPEPHYMPAEPFTAFVKADIPIWAEHARTAGIVAK